MMNQPVTVVLVDPDATHLWGQRLAKILAPGDLVVLTGDLGAGKTTLAQGVAAGLNVRGPITSPTFVIAREHPPLQEGPWLIHVDAYRLGSELELDDLDLDTSLDEAVTLVEWGAGVVEQVSEHRLEVVLRRPDTDGGDQTRVVKVEGFGARWQTKAAREDLASLVD